MEQKQEHFGTIDRDYVETKLFEVLSKHRPEDMEKILAEGQEQESPTKEEVILELHNKSVSIHGIARRADFPEEMVAKIIERFEKKYAYSPTESLTNHLKMARTFEDKPKSGKKYIFWLIALVIIVIVVATYS